MRFDYDHSLYFKNNREKTTEIKYYCKKQKAIEKNSHHDVH